MTDSFPRQKARTRNFTLGAPRSFVAAPDGSRVVFLRSPAGDDPRTALWVFDVTERHERLVAEPSDQTGAAGGEALSVEERARRERAREAAGGIVAYATDRAVGLAAFVQSGRLFVADLVSGGARELSVPTPAFDPRPDPQGRQIAFVHERAIHVVGLADGVVRRVAGDDADTVSWGMAEFVAAEEMRRSRGFWWASDGERLLAARVDEAPVRRLWIADVAEPDAPPRAVRYPQAGTANASVEVHVLRLDGGPAVQVAWDAAAYPYLARARWDERGPLIAVQTRDQRRLAVLAVDPVSGQTSSLITESDAAWVDLVSGVPRRLSDGRLVTVGGVEDTVALIVDGQPVTPPGMEVREVMGASEDAVLFSATTEPTEVHIYSWAAEHGLSELSPEPGVHTAAGNPRTPVIGSRTMSHDGIRWAIGDHVFASRAEQPMLTPEVRLFTLGERELRVGLVLPRGHEPGQTLPVLLDPYGGPQHQRVVASRQGWLESQWLADQGFAVIVADGRGTPGRGRAWARAVRGDLAGPVLEDQIAALNEVAALAPDLDLRRVGIRGWSFGGFLAALAVLRRPDVFHAAVAGAPVTDWRLYDTHYTERYLGVEPDGADRAAYDISSLLDEAAALRRPLLLIHGLVDDNVVAANTLKLSQRLTEAGRLHGVLPLTGITHMTPQEAVAENLLIVQVEFLRRALAQPSAD
ncbi:MAG TPA: prolyl oligopeptidase family serine peptidase [Solirubrobacteraceae bacterium]